MPSPLWWPEEVVPWAETGREELQLLIVEAGLRSVVARSSGEGRGQILSDMFWAAVSPYGEAFALVCARHGVPEGVAARWRAAARSAAG
eukprot:13392590-Alexandrium_andersonii.AAC.1